MLRGFGIWLAGLLAQAALLFWAKLGVADGPAGHAILILTQSASFLALLVLYIEGLTSGTRRIRCVFSGSVVALATTTIVGAALLPDTAGLGLQELLLIHGVQSMPLLALALARRFWTEVGTAGLEVLICGGILLLLPFLLDTVLQQNRSPDEVKPLMEWSLKLSTWPRASYESLQFDVFKSELVYRNYRFGEQIYRYPDQKASITGVCLISGAILLLGLSGLGAKRLFTRLWTP